MCFSHIPPEGLQQLHQLLVIAIHKSIRPFIDMTIAIDVQALTLEDQCNVILSDLPIVNIDSYLTKVARTVSGNHNVKPGDGLLAQEVKQICLCVSAKECVRLLKVQGVSCGKHIRSHNHRQNLCDFGGHIQGYIQHSIHPVLHTRHDVIVTFRNYTHRIKRLKDFCHKVFISFGTILKQIPRE